MINITSMFKRMVRNNTQNYASMRKLLYMYLIPTKAKLPKLHILICFTYVMPNPMGCNAL